MTDRNFSTSSASTPRTDEVSDGLEKNAIQNGKHGIGGYAYASLDFARQLERELDETRAKYERCQQSYVAAQEREAAQSATLPTAAQELRNFIEAKRFDLDTFASDTEFADWVLSRCRFALAAVGGKSDG